MNNWKKNNLFKKDQTLIIQSKSEYLIQKRKFETSLPKTSIEIPAIGPNFNSSDRSNSVVEPPIRKDILYQVAKNIRRLREDKKSLGNDKRCSNSKINGNSVENNANSTGESPNKSIKFSLSNNDTGKNLMDDFTINGVGKYVQKSILNKDERICQFNSNDIEWKKYFSKFHSLDRLTPIRRRRIFKRIDYIPSKMNKVYDNVYLNGRYYMDDKPYEYSQVISLLNEKPKRQTSTNIDILEERASDKNFKPFTFLQNEERSKEEQRRRLRKDFWKFYPEYLKRFEQIRRPMKYDSCLNKTNETREKEDNANEEEEDENDKENKKDNNIPLYRKNLVEIRAKNEKKDTFVKFNFKNKLDRREFNDLMWKDYPDYIERFKSMYTPIEQ
ncbi:DgyrCDS5876 [Dimorphilus gyrociliatus]|uniref:DgyrCDS5876 n=1 Tax=Dimorphilus gyrociliatus TaxID=2664684 RepID=A0A7I8VR36_9ANNE|nr:DgyrCDS5876 [Dimorphilus gyrociliatus]